MKNLIIILILIFTIIACRNNNSKKKLNETIKYYPNKTNVIYKKIIHKPEFDSVYYFYNNGLLFKKGKQYEENQKFGIWKLYDKNSNLREIREWFTINKVSRINRVWHLNANEDTIAWRYQDSIYKQSEFINDTMPYRYTNYDQIHFFKDTIKLNEAITGYIVIGSRILINYPNYHVRAFIPVGEKNYNYDFSNGEEVELRTFYDLTIDTANQKWFKSYKFNEVVALGKWFETTGNKTIRGYYQQYSYGPFEMKNKQKPDSIIGYKTYFEKEIYVKDSVE